MTFLLNPKCLRTILIRKWRSSMCLARRIIYNQIESFLTQWEDLNMESHEFLQTLVKLFCCDFLWISFGESSMKCLPV